MAENLRDRQDQSRTFSEELDRRLAAPSAPPEQPLDKDLAEALDFARRISALRQEPSPLFQASLKARLLQKIEAAEEKKRARASWWTRYLPQKPLWQAAAAVAVVLLVVGIAWASGAFRTHPSPIVSLPGKYVQATASTDKAVYASGEDVEIQVTLQNISSENLTIAQYPPILSLMQVSTLEPVYTFSAGETSRTLAPGQSISYSQTWDQVGFGGQKVPAGKYSLELEDIDFHDQAIKLTLARPVEFEIRDSLSRMIAPNSLSVGYQNNAGPVSGHELADLLSRRPGSAVDNM